MKTNVPNQFINHPNTLLLFKIPPILMMKQLILLLIFTFFSVSISAQVRKIDVDAPKILEVKAFISSLNATNSTARKSRTDKSDVEKLLFDIQPSIYFNSGDVKTYGEKPKNFFVDFQHLNKLSSSNLLKNNIEIVTIKINNQNELNSTVDLSAFSSFKNLKYIYIVSNVSTSDRTLSKMIVNYNEKYSIFYSIDKGE